MAVKEPKFMQELHRIRVKMAKEWEKMSAEEIRKSLRSSSEWLKRQIAIRSTKA